jgi:hypothetical protein
MGSGHLVTQIIFPADYDQEIFSWVFVHFMTTRSLGFQISFAAFIHAESLPHPKSSNFHFSVNLFHGKFFAHPKSLLIKF